MTKKRKSKILAAALCTAVMAGIYASPVMAANLDVNINGQLEAVEAVGLGAERHPVEGTFTIAGSEIAAALSGESLNVKDITASGTVSVDQGVYVENNGITVENGGLTVNAGDTVLQGLSAGATTLDSLTVTGAAEFQSDAKVDGLLDAHQAKVGAAGLEVVGDTTMKSTLKVDGQTTLNGLSAGATTVDSLETTSGKFTVSADGYTVIDNQLDVTGLANVGELTAKKAGVTGDLQVAGQTTLNGLKATGAASLENGLKVTNGTETDTLKVTGDTTLNGLTAGATTVNSLTVNTTAEVNGKLTANDGLKVTNGTETDTLTVTGAATVDSLEVAKDAQVGGKLTVGNGLDVTGNALLNDDLTVNGATKLNGDVTVGGEAKFNEKATFNGKAIFNENIDVNGFANLNSGAKVNGELIVNGATKVNNNLTVNGNTLVNGELNISNGKFKVDADGNTEFIGNLNIGHGNFTVDAATGNTVVKGSLNLGSLDGREVGEAIKDLEAYADELKGAALPDKVGGIERDPAGAGAPGNGTTTIEGKAEFDSEGMTIGETVVNDGKITVGAAADNQTTIEGGAITADSLTLGSLGEREVGAVVNALEQKTAGIERDDATGTTTIEGATSFDATGMSIKDEYGLETRLDAAGISISNGEYSTQLTSGGAIFAGAGITKIDGGRIETASLNVNGIEFERWHDEVNGRLDVLEDKTQNIKPGAGTGTGAGGASGLTGGEGTGEPTIPVPPTGEGHTGIVGDVTVGGEINAGQIVVGEKDSENKTTITDGSITTDKGDFGSAVTVGENTTITDGNITVGEEGNKTTINGGNVTVNGGENGSTNINGGTITTGDIDANTGDFKYQVTVGDNTTITGDGIITGTGTFDGVTIGENTTINSNGIDTNDIQADTGTIGNVDMDNNGITVGGGTAITKDTVDTTYVEAQDGNFSNSVTVGENTTITDGKINLGGEDGTNISADGMIVGNANGVNTNVSAGDVVITDKDGKDIALSNVGYVEDIDRELQANDNYDGTVVGGINAEADIRRAEVDRLDNRITKVEDRVDKVGAMSAAIANLRTMGYDPAAPTEIAVGLGQYRSETGLALGMFHYPNKDFMLSLSVSTSGEEVMGGIGATWRFGRKSPEQMLAAEKEKAAKAKVAKALAMKKAAEEAKVAAQQARHAKMAAERAAK